jgi:hypothetical protein
MRTIFKTAALIAVLALASACSQSPTAPTSNGGSNGIYSDMQG